MKDLMEPGAFGYRARKSWTYAFFSDEFNHLSIREGIRASGAPSVAFRHLDMNDLERKLESTSADIKFIVTDGVFSQHGDIAPLPEMLALAERHDASIYLDDAHGTGVLGATGAGTPEYWGIESPRLIHMGTLSKAYGSLGGFVATESYVARILRLGCSAYGFTSTLPPDQAAAVLEAAECARLAAGLREEGIHVDAIMFPAVARGQSLLRFMLNAHHTSAHIEHVVQTLAHLFTTR